MRRYTQWLALVAGLALSVPATARAQKTGGRRGDQGTGEMRGGQDRGEVGPERMRMQRRIRQAFTRAVRNQVGLSDEQMRQLAPINRKYVGERQALEHEERATRMALRDELGKAQPNQDSVAKLSEKLQAFPRQRLDLNDAEGKDLGGIMTPVQVARFRALQERVQRQLNAMRPPAGGDARPLSIPDSSRGGGPGPG